jgi:carboxylesterase
MAQVLAGHEAWSGGDGPVGVLVLHGYTSSPYGMRGLAEHIAAAGHRVELPRYPGHGTHWKDLAKTTWRSWAREAIGALEVLRNRTQQQVVLGLSMGGTLALHLAETRDDIAGVVLLNPFVSTTDPIARLLPVLKWVVPSVAGLGNDIALEGADEQPYDRNPVRSQASVVELANMVRSNLAAVTCPTLVFTSRQDHVVEPGNGRQVLEGVSSTDIEQVWLERSFHVAQLDHDAPEIERRTLDFIARVTATRLTP